MANDKNLDFEKEKNYINKNNLKVIVYFRERKIHLGGHLKTVLNETVVEFLKLYFQSICLFAQS